MLGLNGITEASLFLIRPLINFILDVHGAIVAHKKSPLCLVETLRMANSVEAVIDVSECASWLGLQTRSAHKQLQSRLEQWTSHPGELQQKSAEFQQLQKVCRAHPEFITTCKKHFQEIAEIEDTPSATNDIEHEAYGEILFFRPFLKPLNFVPFFLSIWAALRTYIMPGIAFLAPFLALIAPYVILTFVLHAPLTLKGYASMLQSMTTGNLQGVFDSATDAAASTTSFTPENASWIKQFAIALITMVQGLIQPYWTYKHLKNVDGILCTQGEQWLTIRRAYDGLYTQMTSHGLSFPRNPLQPIDDKRIAAAHLLTESMYMTLALQRMGSLEVLLCMATHHDLSPVRWVSALQPVFRLTDTYDFRVHAAQRKKLTIRLDHKVGRHALLTGPNKGGKSTVLRSIAVSGLLAHTYGCSIGSLVATPIDKMFVCLKPDDLPGSKSRFEREIDFTTETLGPHGRTLVLIDELYHSTNPPDALRSCEIYSDLLWNKPQHLSVISTHLFDWVEHAPSAIQRLCCPATAIPIKGSNRCDVQFHYTLVPGICKVSSVDSLLEKMRVR